MATINLVMERSRLRWPGFQRELVIYRLLTTYGERIGFDRAAAGRWSNPDFMREFVNLVELTEQAGPAADEAKRMAGRHGLKAPWASARLIREAAANARLRRSNRIEPKPWDWHWPIFPLVPMLVSHSDEMGLQDWRERELDRNIQWLYRRIALKDTPTQIMHRHNDGQPNPDRYVRQDAVEEGIRKLARVLELTLPRTH